MHLVCRLQKQHVQRPGESYGLKTKAPNTLPANSQQIHLLQDELELGKALQHALNPSNLSAQWVRLTECAKRLLAAETYALAGLDIGRPDGSRLELLN